ncbi:hypothetical protein BN1708_007826, partial [Verticillium longisporum]
MSRPTLMCSSILIMAFRVTISPGVMLHANAACAQTQWQPVNRDRRDEVSVPVRVCQWTRCQCFSSSDACAGCWDMELGTGRWALGVTSVPGLGWQLKSHGPTATVTLIAPPARHGPGVMAGLSQPWESLPTCLA